MDTFKIVRKQMGIRLRRLAHLTLKMGHSVFAGVLGYAAAVGMRPSASSPSDE